jgi:UDP-N-acetylmuramate--alanine ligase
MFANRVYFIGIGGIGMSGLAEILVNRDYEVEGSDVAKTEVTERLETLGVKINYSHCADNIDDKVQMVVFSAAIDASNKELVKAKKMGIPVITRGEMLADIMRLKKDAVAVAGTHGKTTTSSLIFSVLEESDIETTAIIGGILIKNSTNAWWGNGDYLVAETDEHDGSFLKLFPSVSVVTNIDEEHMEYYPTLEDLKNAFLDFIHKVPFYGFSVLCIDDENIKSIIEQVKCNKILYGVDEQADITAENIVFSNDILDVWVSFDVISRNERFAPIGKIGSLKVNAIGMHNVLNILASVCVGIGLGLEFELIKAGLEKFSGIKRRFEIKNKNQDFILIEDYAHHPREIKAVLDSVSHIKRNRLIVVFQPHLYSRTQYFWGKFAKELACADLLVLLDIYPAREEPLPGINSANLIEDIKRSGNREYLYIENKDKAVEYISNVIEKDDLVLVLGAGDVYEISDRLAKLDFVKQ